MTNFEKWKEGLTVKEFGKIIVEAYCDDCPAKGDCERRYSGNACRKNFLKWANKEAT